MIYSPKYDLEYQQNMERFRLAEGRGHSISQQIKLDQHQRLHPNYLIRAQHKQLTPMPENSNRSQRLEPLKRSFLSDPLQLSPKKEFSKELTLIAKESGAVRKQVGDKLINHLQSKPLMNEDILRQLRFGQNDLNSPKSLVSNQIMKKNHDDDMIFGDPELSRKLKKEPLDRGLNKLKNINIQNVHMQQILKDKVSHQKELLKAEQQMLREDWKRDIDRSQLSIHLHRHEYEKPTDIHKNDSFVLTTKNNKILQKRSEQQHLDPLGRRRQDEIEKQFYTEQVHKSKNSIKEGDSRKLYFEPQERTPRSQYLKQMNDHFFLTPNYQLLREDENHQVNSNKIFLRSPKQNQHSKSQGQRDAEAKLRDLFESKQRVETLNHETLTPRSKNQQLTQRAGNNQGGVRLEQPKNTQMKILKLHTENARLDRDIQLEKQACNNFYRMNQKDLLAELQSYNHRI